MIGYKRLAIYIDEYDEHYDIWGARGNKIEDCACKISLFALKGGWKHVPPPQLRARGTVWVKAQFKIEVSTLHIVLCIVEYCTVFACKMSCQFPKVYWILNMSRASKKLLGRLPAYVQCIVYTVQYWFTIYRSYIALDPGSCKAIHIHTINLK